MNTKYLKSIFPMIGCFLLLLLSCNKNDDCCTNIDTNIGIHYLQSNGLDLIDNSEDFSADKIKIYYKIDGEFQYIFKGNLDHPNMHYLSVDENGKNRVTIFPNNNYEGNFSETLIELNESTTDTIRCEFLLEGNNQICTNVWYNGLDMNSRFFEITK